MKKIKHYKVDDNCERIIYDDLEAALECIEEMLDGIDAGYPIKIEVVEMTEEEFEGNFTITAFNEVGA